jgi:Methyltransferase FkbM domain
MNGPRMDDAWNWRGRSGPCPNGQRPSVRPQRPVGNGELDDFTCAPLEQTFIVTLKLDLEGGEYDALRGAQSILSEFQPVDLFRGIFTPIR